MILCRVVGNAITALGHPSLDGCVLALCQRLDADGRPEGAPVVAIDPLGAGLHQTVLMTTDGSGAQELVGDPHSPIRNSILALVDEGGPAPA